MYLYGEGGREPIEAPPLKRRDDPVLRCPIDGSRLHFDAAGDSLAAVACNLLGHKWANPSEVPR
jgi:hypothetical protein